MSVILKLENFTATQGWSNANYALDIKNEGDENVEDVKLKVIDSSVFDNVEYRYDAYGHKCNCLNVFGSGYIFPNTATIPAGGTRTDMFLIVVKAAAPIQIHNLQCDWQYAVY